MKAVRLHAPGGVDQLRYEECAEPALRRDRDVVVRLHAAGVNRIDLALRAGSALSDGRLPRILGADGAGVVHSVGSAVQRVKPGDAVCLFPFHESGDDEPTPRAHEAPRAGRDLLGVRADGTYAEYVRVPEKNCFALPSGLSFEEAAALPLVYLMAWHLLMTDAEINPGDWVLIVGAGGGIGTAALQIAVALGARVIVASSDDQKLDSAKRLGAVHGVRLGTADAFKSARAFTGKRGVDVAVNCVGGETWAGTLAALARGGRLASCGVLSGTAPKTDLRRIFWNHLKVFTACSATRAEFGKVLDFFAAGQHHPVIDKIFPLKDAGRAHTRLERREQFGKIVLRIE